MPAIAMSGRVARTANTIEYMSLRVLFMLIPSSSEPSRVWSCGKALLRALPSPRSTVGQP